MKTHDMPKHRHRMRTNLKPSAKHKLAVAISTANRGRNIKPPSLSIPPWVMKETKTC